jgi:hypothetical protein
VEKEVQAAGLQAAAQHHEHVESEIHHLRSMSEKQESYLEGMSLLRPSRGISFLITTIVRSA